MMPHRVTVPAAVLILLHSCAPCRNADSTLFKGIEARYGIEVRSDAGEGFFPREWRLPPISASASPPEKRELMRMPGILERALAKYPPPLIRTCVRGIRITGEMRFYGVGYGATSSEDVVYIKARRASDGYTDAYIEGAFHHEIAHMLFGRRPFPAARWRKINPPGFHYRYAADGGLQSIRRGTDSLRGTRALYDRGLLSEYAGSSLEEDVCTYAETALTDPAGLAAIMKKHRRVREKHRLWLEYYRSIDPAFAPAR
jgi:hypothetical protein